MSLQTNTERIIEMLRRFPGLDDDELSKLAEVYPRQQVNQICRWLESRRLLRRAIGPSGKIANYLVGATPSERPAVAQLNIPEGGQTPPGQQRSPMLHATSAAIDYPLYCTSETLILLPCSGAKANWPGRRDNGPSILDHLPLHLAHRLRDARRQVAQRANADESTLVPAWQRYTGSLYQAARDALPAMLAAPNPPHVIIISGGYGLVLAEEPIGIYEAVFHRNWWPRGLLEDILVVYAERHALKLVRAFASLTTEYGRLAGGVAWHKAQISDALILSPEVTTGAMIKSPRAQGEALSALAQGVLKAEWKSSDGLGLVIRRC